MRFTNILISAAAVLSLTATATATAQAQSIAGKWTAEYPARLRMENGGAAVESMGTALLTIEQKGDSVFGSWHPQNTPVASAPRTIIGTVKAGHLEFSSSPIEARVRRSDTGGDEQPIMMRTFFEGTVADDTITGTLYSKTDDGSITSSTLKWSAKRTL